MPARESLPGVRPGDTTSARLGLTTSISPLASPLAAPSTIVPEELLLQMRARLAFARASTRLYEAVLDKLDASAEPYPRSRREPLSRAILLRFHNEEAAHFELLCESLECMGVDPVDALNRHMRRDGSDLDTAQARPFFVDLADALDALLDAERVDEAGWRQLVATAYASGLKELAHRFEQAHAEEIVHVRQLRAWTTLLAAHPRRVA
jgi:hypothetical protein